MTSIMIYTNQWMEGYCVIGMTDGVVTYDATTADLSDALTCARALYDDADIIDGKVYVFAEGFDDGVARSIIGYVTQWNAAEYDAYAAMMAA